MKNLLNAYRTLMTNAKMLPRTLFSVATGFGLFFAVFTAVDAVNNLFDQHRPFFIAASIVAVNVFIYYPALAKFISKSSVAASAPCVSKKQAKPQPAKQPTSAQPAAQTTENSKPTPAVEPEKQTLAEVGEEFAQEIANVSDEDLLDEEVRDLC